MIPTLSIFKMDFVDFSDWVKSEAIFPSDEDWPLEGPISDFDEIHFDKHDFKYWDLEASDDVAVLVRLE